MMFPASELEWWSCCFSIDDKQDKPIIKQEHINLKECKKSFKELWN